MLAAKQAAQDLAEKQLRYLNKSSALAVSNGGTNTTIANGFGDALAGKNVFVTSPTATYFNAEQITPASYFTDE